MKPVSRPDAPPAVLRFACAHCRTPLTVPVTMAGVAGPCPVCTGHVRAPRGSHHLVPAVSEWFRRSVGTEPRWQVLATVFAAGFFGLMGLRILATIQQFVRFEPETAVLSAPAPAMPRSIGS